MSSAPGLGASLGSSSYRSAGSAYRSGSYNSGGYRYGSYGTNPYINSPFAAHYARLYANQQYVQQQMAQRAAAVRHRRIVKNAKTNAARLKAADEARADNDIALASRVYLRVATDRSRDASVQAARRRLAELKTEAQEKHSAILYRVTALLNAASDAPLADADARSLIENMLEFNELAERYGDVPEVGRKIKSTLSTHLKKPDVRFVLCEPDANQLWKDGQELEAQGHICCALLIYEEAEAELPAPSAVLAQERLEQLKSDPRNVEDAKVCRDLKWCHQKYPTAERLAKAEPDRARELYQQIAQRSPADSTIHEEAKKQLAKLQ